MLEILKKQRLTMLAVLNELSLQVERMKAKLEVVEEHIKLYDVPSPPNPASELIIVQPHADA